MTTTADTLTHFTIRMDRHTAIVTMDLEGESVNTLGPKLIGDFEAVLRRLETDPDIRAVVLTSGKQDFLVGADIRFFDELTTSTAAEEAIRTTHQLFARLEKVHARLGKPVVAAIDGNALGGGLELALACSMRIATDSERTQLGQPETQRGVIPAGGGTQRLPKIIGIANALDMILGGKNVRVKKAKSLGLVDEVVPPEMLLEIAVERARSAVGSVDGKSSSFDLSPSGLQKAASSATAAAPAAWRPWSSARNEPDRPQHPVQAGSPEAARTDEGQLPGPRAGSRGGPDRRRGRARGGVRRRGQVLR